jgi:glycogen synthase
VAARGGRAILDSLSRLARLDVAVAVSGGGERGLTDQAAVLGIEHPGKIAVILETTPGAERALLAGADAVLLADLGDHTGRAAGIALRYGAIPLAPEAGANADYLVDYDPASGTGCALLYAAPQPFEIEGVVRRALALRSDSDTWQGLTKWLLAAAPRWSGTAALLEGLEPLVAPVLTA